MDILKRLFEQHFHAPAERVQPLQGELGGSGRIIVRLAGQGATAIGILYDGREENAAFITFSRHFRRHGLPVPEIYAEDISHGAYIEEDLGDTTLFQFLSRNRAGQTIAPLVVDAYRLTVAVLPRFQIEAGRDLNYAVCYPRDSFDRQSIAWDLNYFKYYFLKLAGIPFNEQALEDDFDRLTNFVLGADRDYFLYRDFQSRNVMWREEGPFFVDYRKSAAKAHSNMTSLRSCLTPRLICRPSCASNCSIIISTALPVSSNSTATCSCVTTMASFTSASCRHWAPTAFGVFSSVKFISFKAFLTR